MRDLSQVYVKNRRLKSVCSVKHRLSQRFKFNLEIKTPSCFLVVCTSQASSNDSLLADEANR